MCCDSFMLHNVADAVATCVILNIDKLGYSYT